eukprot:Em0005g773a
MLENYAQANFALQDSNPSALQGRSRKKKASVRDSYKADPEKKKASVRDSYKADPEKKKAFVCDSYKADPEKKKASVRDSYNADIESKQSAKKQRYQEDLEENRAAKRQRYQEDVEENRAAKRPKYEDNSAAIKASERNRYWYDPAVRLAKRAAERKRYRRGHRTTTTTQSYSLYEPKSHALMEYNGGLEKAILRDSELLSEVNDAFCKSHPLLAQKVVTRYARAAIHCCPPTVRRQQQLQHCPCRAELPPPLPHRQQQSCPHLQQQKQDRRYLHQPHHRHQYWHQCPHHHFAAATLAAATTTRMAPMARTRPPRP